MSFSHWCRVVLTAGASVPKLSAQMHNLVSEDRVPEIALVRTSVANEFQAGDPQDISAAAKAVEETQKPLRVATCALLGLIKSNADDHVEYQAVSFVTGTHIERHIIPSFQGRATVMPAVVPLPRTLYARYPRRFFWATFNEEVEGLSPTDIAIALGLPHFEVGETVYRIHLGDWPEEVYIPTCMDSGIFEAWMRPPKSHAEPWGMTRHLLTGNPEKPELLVQVADVEGRGLTAERVGSPGETVSLFSADYLIGRDLASCADDC